ncbi:protein draper-like isoform X2 [Drosophila santomea]|uniref:protein draper-like isoform X2 n=1 Tax=Drosophila santomea TaxID=129105 RepID=UPI001CCE7C88|nr:protein draper-like isoform X2 [Drosophila santomea]
MSHIRSLWVCLAYLIVLVDFIQPDRMNVCPRRQVVSYTRNVLRSRTVPYLTYYHWRGRETKYRTEYYTQDEIAYRTEVRHVCCDGYKGSIPNCQPVCMKKCPAHGFCSSPNTCSCHTGYGGSDCQPNCPAGCGKNEFCDQPGVCSCQNGYNRASSSDNCLPVCREECGHHSFCSEPGKCECEPGYEKMEGGTACLAVCSPKCGENARCQEPQLCTCLDGYKADANGNCLPFCQEDCGKNSRCVRPGMCECDNGYAGDEGGTNCRPECSTCPENGICMSPGVCVCKPGYVMRDDRCQPHCEENCPEYGHCVAPNQCECFSGYESPGADKKCEPKCSKGCSNGFCFSPETCVCNIGYLMGPNQVCEPQCSLNCIHGKCTSPETCSCDPGYRFQNNSHHICDPICDSGCSNGDCVAPNICICHDGYQPNNTNPVTSMCQPVCEDCKFGDCVAPNNCQCSIGYEKVNGVCESQTTTDSNEYSTTTEDSQTSTADLDPHSITTPNAIETPSSEVPHSNCTAGCMCWIEYDGMGTFNTAKCAKVCVDPQDQPCLDLDNCHCDLPSGQLVCQEDSSVDYSGENSRYVCHMLQAKKPKSEAEARIPERTESSQKWMVIMGSCAGMILGVAVAIVGTKYYRRSTFRQNIEVEQAIYESDLE